jgi:phosphinothricin acetyltransferase
MKLRKANIEDIPEITAIYNEAVLNSTATFDTEPKTNLKMKTWFNSHNQKFCIVVCEVDKVVVGWASLSQYSDKIAYNITAEFSIYIHTEYRAKGFSKPLMEYCLNEGQKNGIKTVISRITQGNNISVKLHEHFGFFKVGVLKQVGVKFGAALDVIVMQKLIS